MSLLTTRPSLRQLRKAFTYLKDRDERMSRARAAQRQAFAAMRLGNQELEREYMADVAFHVANARGLNRWAILMVRS